MPRRAKGAVARRARRRAQLEAAGAHPAHRRARQEVAVDRLQAEFTAAAPLLSLESRIVTHVSLAKFCEELGHVAEAPRNEATTPAAPSDAPKKSADDNRKGERKQPAKAAGDARKDNDKEARPTKDGDAPAKGNAKAASDRGKGMDKQDRSAVGGEPKSDRTAKGAEKGGGTVSLTGEQRTQVISGFAKHRSEARENINISVNVGVAVPRSARLHTIPRDILVIYPDYRRYRYFIVDDRVVIVDPVRFVIVDVIVLTA